MKATEQQPQTAQPSHDGNGNGADTAPHGTHRHAHAMGSDALPHDLPKPGTFTVVLVALLFVGLLAGLFVIGWFPHERAAQQAQSDATEAAGGKPAVSAARPHIEPSAKDITLPADLRANQQTALFTRANGYLKQWFFDVGAQVKKDQVLAIIDTPDVDAQYAQGQANMLQAQANVSKANSDVDVALTDYNRYLKTQKESPGSVNQEDVDTKKAAYEDAAAAQKVAVAAVAADQADLNRIGVIQGFEKITAPFDGTVTARNYDVGAMLNPNTTAAGSEIFDVADTSIIRVYVNVPQPYATQMSLGQKCYLEVRNYPGREFTGVVSRQSGALNLATRTLQFELDFQNADGQLYAGMYAQARLPVAQSEPTLTIPSSALVFGPAGLQVAIVKDGKTHFQKVTAGRDMGVEIEIATGISADDEVVGNPGERLSEGGDVQVTYTDQPAPADQTARAAGAN